MLRAAWDRGLNALATTSVGRLFEAAAALVGSCSRASYEGEAAMRLEALCDGLAPPAPLVLPLERDAGGIWRSDWAPLLPMLLDAHAAPAARAALFHSSLAHALCEQAMTLRRHTGVTRIGLSGGVFQNRRLTEQAQSQLGAAGFEVLIPRRLPVNDAAISFGQLIEAMAIERIAPEIS
jgi:hydrogenase maturation protein HypF